MVWTNTLYAMWTRSKQKLTLDDKLDEKKTQTLTILLEER